MKKTPETNEPKNIDVSEYIYNKDGSLAEIITPEFGSLKMSYWEEKILFRFSGVEFQLPGRNGNHLKFIGEHLQLTKSGVVQLIPNYYRSGVYTTDEKGKQAMITRCYYHSNNEKTINLPLGEKVVGDLIIKRSFNSKTKEKRIILNFYYNENQGEKKYRVAINSDSAEKAVAEVIVPGTSSLIKVFRTKD